MARGAPVDTYDGLSLLEKSPQIYGDAFRQFRVCHDLCRYTSNKILDAKMRDTIDQCAVDFRHMSLQTTTLSEQVSSVWCQTCILLYENVSKIRGDPCEILNKISAQAKDLSNGFSCIARWCRKLAANFHSAQTLAESKSEEYRECMEEAKEKAEKAMKTLRTQLNEAVTEAEKKRKRADRWLIAAGIPIVNLVAGVGALVTAKSALNAQKLLYDTDTLCDDAIAKLEKATSNSEKAKVMAENVGVLVMHLHQIEGTCETIAAFWQMESDKFSAVSSKMESVKDFVKIGLHDEAVKEQLEYLRERKTELEKYQKIMTAVNAAYNFQTGVEPSHFSPIELPTLGLTLK